jgi:DNA-binding response OmpR family regulator
MEPEGDVGRQAEGDGAAQPPAQPETRMKSGDGSRSLGSARLIAIVEDDHALAATFQQALKQERGWDAIVLGDGQEALRQLPEVRPDMILLDVALPGLDGISLYRMLRGRRETQNTPILIVTASREWEVRRYGLEPRQFLHKPFDIDELLTAVERLLP